MRAMLLFPLALAAAVGAAGCGTASRDSEQTAFQPPRRDLTLRQADPAEVEVASPVELAHASAQASATRHERKRVAASQALAKPAVSVTPVAALRPVSPTPVPAAPAVAEAPDPHALAPGQTVTVLTVSTASAGDGPSGGDWTDRLPADRGRGTTIRGGRGGDCGPRGHGGRPNSGGGFRGGLR